MLLDAVAAAPKDKHTRVSGSLSFIQEWRQNGAASTEDAHRGPYTRLTDDNPSL